MTPPALLTEAPPAEGTYLDDFFLPEAVCRRAALTEGKEDKHVLKVIFLAGAGGAGKGAVADAMFAGTGMKVVNADKHLERFLKELKIPFSEVGGEYGLFRKARDLMQKEMRHYALARLGLIVDSTGWEYNRIADPLKKFRKLGYDAFMVFVDTSLETALARNKARAAKGGRKVPDSFVKDAWHGSQRNKKKFAKLFGKKRFFLIDNDKDVEKQTWTSVITPKLRSLSNRILRAAVKNKIGVAWLKSGKRTTKASRAAEWPKPKKPKPVVFKFDEPKTPKSKVNKKGVPAGRKGKQKMSATFTGDGKADLGALFPELFGRSYIRPKESLDESDNVSAIYEGKKGPMWKTLEKNKVKLSDDERAEVMRRKAVWHHGPQGEASPAVWKAVIKGVAWFVTNTHRAFNVRPTLAGAISRYHKFIKSTA